MLDDVFLSLLEGFAVHLSHALNKANYLLDLCSRVLRNILTVVFGFLDILMHSVPKRVDTKFSDLFIKALHVLLALSHFFSVNCVAVNFPLFVFKV